MANNVCCCFFSNNVRHLVLCLSVACSSVLFANFLLLNVTVLYKTNIPFSLQSRHFVGHDTSQSEIVRKLRDLINETEDDFFGEITRNGLPDVKKNSFGYNFSTTGDVAILDSESEANTFSDGHPVLQPEFDSPKPYTTTSTMATTLRKIIITRPSLEVSTENPKVLNASVLLTAISASSLEYNPGAKLSSFDGKDVITKSAPLLEEVGKMDEMVEKVVNFTNETKVDLLKNVEHLLVWSSPGFGMFFGALFSIWWMKSLGARKLIAIALFVSAVSTLSLGFIRLYEISTIFVIGVRFFQGLAFGSVLPMIGTLAANWATLKEQYFFIVWGHLFIQITPLVSWSMSAWLLKKNFILVFVVHTVATVLLALIWYFFYRDRPQYHPWVNGLELNKIVTGKIKAVANRSIKKNDFSLLFSSPPVWAVWISGFGHFIVIALLLQYLPIYCHFILALENPIYYAALPFIFMLLMTLLYSLWNYLANFCGEKKSPYFFNTLSFTLSAAVFIFLAISSFNLRYSGAAISVLLFAMVLSFYGFYRSAVLVGRFYAQYIIAYSQIGVAVAFIFVSSLVFFFERPRGLSEWRVIFVVISAIQLVSAAAFMIIGSTKAEEWSKHSWDPSSGRRLISVDQIDLHNDECGLLEMKIMNK